MNKMKKWLAILMSGVLLFNLASCASKPEDSSDDSAATSTESIAESTESLTESAESMTEGTESTPDSENSNGVINNSTGSKSASSKSGTSSTKSSTSTASTGGSSIKTYDLKGKTVKILLQGTTKPYPDPELDTYEQTVARIKAIEKAFNCKLSFNRDYQFPAINEYIVSCSVAGVDFADIAWVGPWYSSAYIGANIATPLDDSIDFSQPYLKNNKATEWSVYKGKHYTMPVSYSINDSLIAYNKDILSKLGYDPFELQKSGDWTWEKFLEIARAATVRDSTGKTTQWGVVTVPGGDFIHQIFASNNTDVIEYNGTQFTNTMKNNNAVIECLNFMKDIQVTYKCGLLSEMVKTNPLPESGAANWKNGTAAMAFTCVTDAKNYTPKNVGFVVFPKGPKADKYYVSSNGGAAYMVPSTSKIQKEAGAILYAWHAYWDNSLAGGMSESELKAWTTANAPDKVRAAFSKNDLVTFSLAVTNARMMHITRTEEIQQMIFSEIFPDITTKNVDVATALANKSSQAQKVIDDLNKSLAKRS